MIQPREKEEVILIVDDNQKNIQVLGNILKEEGYNISIALNGYKAIEIAENIIPTLILLDVMMPEIDGFQVCENLKSKPKTRSIPVIFLTAKVETEDVLEGFRKGGVDYITKPFKKEELLARVKTHIVLENTKKQLVSSNAQKDRIFSIVSHDLKGPLSSFQMLLGILLQNPKKIQQEKFIDILGGFKDDIDSIYSMLNNLLTWAKNEMKGESLEPVKFKINAIVLSAIKFLNISAKKKKITFTNNVSDDLEVFADVDMSSAIIRNLLNNSLKFSYTSSEIIINATKDEDFIVVSVHDSGIGIPAEKQQELLSEARYYTSVGTDNEKGSGLGLKICESFAKKNKGKLWFESEQGKGSVFYFSLPCSV